MLTPYPSSDRFVELTVPLQEETERPISFIMSGKAAEAIAYDGDRAGPR